MMNWGSNLSIYNKTRQERLRRAQGLYTADGAQTALAPPTDVNALDVVESALYPSLEVRPQPSTWEVHARLLRKCALGWVGWGSARLVARSSPPTAPAKHIHAGDSRLARCGHGRRES